MVDVTGEGKEPLRVAFDRRLKLEFHGARMREKLVKIGARIVRHGRYVVFQLAEVAVPRSLFAEILRRIGRLRGSPVPAT